MIENYRNISTPFLFLDYTAFDVGYQPTGLDFPSPGLLRNMNTIASFNNIDKELLDTCGRLILESIKNGDCLKNPSLLTSFLLLTYADLKKYCFIIGLDSLPSPPPVHSLIDLLVVWILF
uniref:Ubiquitin-like modifier-activating enzyme Atg7 N-terminal domain-containing protein n=1 Tax=Amphimedon queenslandica TaxID=400682 RepID=A0A1X7TLK8_AMPQE